MPDTANIERNWDPPPCRRGRARCALRAPGAHPLGRPDHRTLAM